MIFDEPHRFLFPPVALLLLLFLLSSSSSLYLLPPLLSPSRLPRRRSILKRTSNLSPSFASPLIRRARSSNSPSAFPRKRTLFRSLVLLLYLYRLRLHSFLRRRLNRFLFPYRHQNPRRRRLHHSSSSLSDESSNSHSSYSSDSFLPVQSCTQST